MRILINVVTIWKIAEKSSNYLTFKITYYPSFQNVRAIMQFARIHTSSLMKIEKTLNRPITKFYNDDDVNVIAAELRLTKTRPTSFNKKHNLL